MSNDAPKTESLRILLSSVSEALAQVHKLGLGLQSRVGGLIEQNSLTQVDIEELQRLDLATQTQQDLARFTAHLASLVPHDAAVPTEGLRASLTLGSLRKSLLAEDSDETPESGDLTLL